MAGRPPRNNRNPCGANQDENPPPPPRVNLSQEDMMAIATIVAATLQGFVNPLANAIQPHQVPQPLPEELRVEVVTPFLEDRARKLWETVSPSLAEVEDITWQIFKIEFLKQYYPAEFRLQKLNEFENFRHTPDMTVLEYTSRFNDLGTYVPTIMSDETLKMHHFKRGLNSRIQSALAVFKPNNFADLMSPAMSAETDIKHREDENRDKRPLVNQTTQNGPKFKKPNNSSGPPRGNFNSACNTEGKRFAKKLKLEHHILSEPLRVATPACKIIETHKVYRNCQICISKQDFEAELIQLNMIELDVILGMDWLAKNHAIVDCQRKDIRLQTLTMEEVIYYGKSKERKSLLSASQAWKAIKGGEEIYLAVINEVKKEETPKLEDIPIVQEFPDVFPKELSGEIPDRELSWT
ncbi:uncharacterized protein LOC142537621 [Primulina tabacum]|uniref:uncharacterized protein LOC142537621 n=1 Tax=Primulina tabacum TaxID=48773 RepID=UPI003F5A51BD